MFTTWSIAGGGKWLSCNLGQFNIDWILAWPKWWSAVARHYCVCVLKWYHPMQCWYYPMPQASCFSIRKCMNNMKGFQQTGRCPASTLNCAPLLSGVCNRWMCRERLLEIGLGGLPVQSATTSREQGSGVNLGQWKRGMIWGTIHTSRYLLIA